MTYEGFSQKKKYLGIMKLSVTGVRIVQHGGAGQCGLTSQSTDILSSECRAHSGPVGPGGSLSPPDTIESTTTSSLSLMEMDNKYCIYNGSFSFIQL